MPYFLILAPDRGDALNIRIANRQDHLDYWADMPGVVKIAGAMLEDGEPSGSSFLIEAADAVEAEALISGDPFTRVGVFTGDHQIVPIRPAIGEWLPRA